MTLQPTASLTPLKLAGGALGFNWLPVFVARERGIFERHGLAVELCRLGSVDKATAAVRTGEADLAISPPEGVLADAAAQDNARRGWDGRWAQAAARTRHAGEVL